MFLSLKSVFKSAAKYRQFSSSALLRQKVSESVYGSEDLEDEEEYVKEAGLVKDERNDDRLTIVMRGTKTFGALANVVEQELQQLQSHHVVEALRQIERHTRYVKDREKRGRLMAWTEHVDRQIIEQFKLLMPVDDPAQTLEIALYLGRRVPKRRPTDFVDLILIDMSKKLLNLTIRQRVLLLLAAAYNGSNLKFTCGQIVSSIVGDLQQEENQVLFDSGTLSAFVYSVGMLDQFQQAKGSLQIMYDLVPGRFETLDHLTMFLQGLLGMDVQITKEVKDKLINLVTYGIDKNLTPPQLVHMVSTGAGMQLLAPQQIDQQLKLMLPFLSTLKAYSLNELFWGLSKGQHKVQNDVLKALVKGVQQYLQRNVQIISKDQLASLYRGLNRLGVNRQLLQGDIDFVGLPISLDGDLLSIGQFGRHG